MSAMVRQSRYLLMVATGCALIAMLGWGAVAQAADLDDAFAAPGTDVGTVTWIDEWRHRQASEEYRLQECLDDLAACDADWLTWRKVVLEGQSLPREAQIALANAFGNRVRYVSAQRMPARRIASVAEALAGLHYRCLDVAAMKVDLLTRLGWDPADLRLAVVQEAGYADDHAVAVVRHEGRVVILDHAAPPRSAGSLEREGRTYRLAATIHPETWSVRAFAPLEKRAAARASRLAATLNDGE